MHTYKQIDLSVLPDKAQEELYDFYLFLKQRYINKTAQTKTIKPKYDETLESLLDNTQKHKIYVDPSVDIRELIDEANDVEL